MLISAIEAKRRFEAHIAGDGNRSPNTPVWSMYLDRDGLVVVDHTRIHIPLDFAKHIALALTITDGRLDSPGFEALVVYEDGAVVDWAHVHRPVDGLLRLEWLRGTSRDHIQWMHRVRGLEEYKNDTTVDRHDVVHPPPGLVLRMLRWVVGKNH
jgi:hypothetical protein